MSNSEVQKVAEEYQVIDRQIKALQAKQKPLKSTLIAFAEGNTDNFDDAFQYKFPNGTYLSMRVKDCIEGDAKSKTAFLEEAPEFVEAKLDEKRVLSEAPKDNRLRKLLTQFKLSISQKQVFAVYAG